MINLYIHIHAYSYMEDRITDACLPHSRADVSARIYMRVGLGAQASAQQRASTFRRRGLRVGRQVFLQASAFNANIGTWNTARVTKLWAVCAAHTHTCTRTHANTSII